MGAEIPNLGDRRAACLGDTPVAMTCDGEGAEADAPIIDMQSCGLEPTGRRPAAGDIRAFWPVYRDMPDLRL
ncbi:MAG: hypothetical protein Kow0073_19650 [Immundisolibacter sp.]